MSSLALPLSAPTVARRPAADLSRATRLALVAGAAAVTLPTLAALARAGAGVAPHAGALKEVALAVHLMAVVPALPLGAWLLWQRKGTPRHRRLGKLWVLMMVVGATSAIAIRHLNHGSLSAIHLLVPVVLVTCWRVVATARAGDIVRHKRVLVGLFVGGLIVPALLAMMPGRLMLGWLLG